jgi:hypothetical protein
MHKKELEMRRAVYEGNNRNRQPIKPAPGLSTKPMIPCITGKVRFVATLSELCGHLRDSRTQVLGTEKTVEMIVAGKKTTRRVIDPGRGYDVVVFKSMTTPNCWAYKSQIIRGL